MDDDNDNLTLTWDFGDGTEPVVQVTGPALVGVECLQNHTWIMDPEMWYGIGETEITYYMNLSLTDGFDHWTNTTTLIRISLDRHNFSPTGNISVLARIVDPADTVTIYGNASDAEGEPLTWTFVFSNSSEIIHIAVYQTGLTEPGEKVFQNTTYIFSTPGNYTVALYLTDLSLPELQIDPDYASHNSSVGSVTISSVSNRLPSVLASISIVDCYTGLQDPMLSEVTGIALVGFSIQANDLDGDVLYATWDFGDGSEETYNVSDGGTSKYRFNQTHSYSRTGQFNVSVIVTDGRPGHEVLRYRVFNITSFNNSPELKSLKVILSNSSYGLPGSVVRFELYLFDLERDSLEVRWDFGDGSPAEYTNVTVFDENGNVTIVVNHTYGEIGTYRMWVNFTDRIYGQLGYHQEYYPSDVVIRFAPPAAEVDPWSWWDYTSLAILILAIVLLILWSVIGSLKRRRIDSLGMTKEEYLLRKKKIDSFDEKHRREEDIR
jgi:PKD repeat protein